MAKQAYKIPADLNTSYLDMEINIQSKDGIGLRPLPLKVVFGLLAGIVGCFWIVSHTAIRYGSGLQIVLFVILWAALCILLIWPDKSKLMRIELVPALLNYIPKASRYVVTRTTASAYPFFRICGIESVDKKTGLVKFTDDTYGYYYMVVGSASVLLFDEDRDAILNRVDMFYRKLGTEVEVSFITTKSAQSVYRQVAALKRRYDALDTADTELRELANEQFQVLKNYVGGSFKSIHQYMVLKGYNKEALVQAKNVLQSEVENSSLMIKRCIPLYYDGIIDVCKQIYRGDSEQTLRAEAEK